MKNCRGMLLVRRKSNLGVKEKEISGKIEVVLCLWVKKFRVREGLGY